MDVSHRALQLQSQWLQRSIQVMRSVPKQEVLRALMEQILQDVVSLTSADRGSIFLVDAELRVIEAVLARGQVSDDRQQFLVGEVLDKGFGGWVLRHRTFGLITDTGTDERWVCLPDQPYQTRSVLGAPLLYSDIALGVLTLMHSQPDHFSPDQVELIRVLHDQMALLIENARLYAQPSLE
jgi:sigma-B regulation protein RsbU (phosphoserine phosphatase)